EPPPPGEAEPADADWLVLVDPAGRTRPAFQRVDRLTQPTWPEGPVPQQLHLDLSVPTTEGLVEQHERALSLGARLLDDRFDDPVDLCTCTPIQRGSSANNLRDVGHQMFACPDRRPLRSGSRLSQHTGRVPESLRHGPGTNTRSM